MNPTLSDDVVRLEPLTLDHVPGLTAAADGDRSPSGSPGFRTVRARCFATCRRRWRNRPPATPQDAEIGFTWYAPRVQRTGLNTAAKSLLLTRAFDDWSALRVRLKTDARNARSRAAIERLGASLDGVLRVVPNLPGGVRDAAYYSIVREEWPAVKARLEAMRHRAG